MAIKLQDQDLLGDNANYYTLQLFMHCDWSIACR